MLTDSRKEAVGDVSHPDISNPQGESSGSSGLRAVDAPITKPVSDFDWWQDCGYEENMADSYAAEMTSCTVGPMPAKLFLSDFLPYNQQVRSSSTVLEDEHRECHYFLAQNYSHFKRDRIRSLVSSMVVSDIFDGTDEPLVH